VRITPKGESYEEFPDHPGLADFDPSDRKFVAAANAHPDRPPILQATDSKWWGWSEALEACGLSVVFLCPSTFGKSTRRRSAHERILLQISLHPPSGAPRRGVGPGGQGPLGSEREEFLRHPLVVEEKVDGANLGLSFDPQGNLRAQNRGTLVELPGRGSGGNWGPGSPPGPMSFSTC
jgi:hypothetical protein